MTFDMLQDSSSFGNSMHKLIAYFPSKFVVNSSFSLLLVIFKYTATLQVATILEGGKWYFRDSWSAPFFTREMWNG